MAKKKNPADAFLPHPTETWYDRKIGTTGGSIDHVFCATPEQRRSYTRFILAGHGGERSWELPELADWDPSALAPWADAVVAFDNASLVQLCEVDNVDFWRASKGASDAAVDKLADKIARSPPRSAGMYGPTEPANARVELLIGVDSDHSLARLGDVARKSKVIREMCARRGVHVPRSGMAVRRYVSHPQEIVRTTGKGEPRLRAFPPVAEFLVDVRGLGCARPVVANLAIDLSLLAPAFTSTAVKTFPFLAGTCQDCDADEDVRAYGWRPVMKGKGKGKLAFDEPRDEQCPGHGKQRAPKKLKLGVSPGSRYSGAHPDRFGRLGGWPSWAQAHPEWPIHCDKPMFFVGGIYRYDYGGTGAHDYGFVCECGDGQQVVQTT